MILHVVRTGWMNLRRDRAALILSFVVPIVFFSIFAGVFGSTRSGTSRVRVAIVDEDHSERSRRLVEALKQERALRLLEQADEKQPQKFDRKTAGEFVRGGDAPVALIIPKGFGSSQLQLGPNATAPELQLIADRSDPIAPQIITGLVQKATMNALPDLFMKGGMDAMDRWGGGLTPSQRAILEQQMRALETTGTTTSGGGETPSASGVLRVTVQDVAGRDPKRPLIAFYAAGIGVMFMLFTASGAGGALLDEHESGTLDRILTTRVSMSTLLLGKLAYLTTLGVVQLMVMFLWGALVFKLDLLPHLAGFAVMAIVTALACSSFGLVLASLAHTRAQLSALSTLVVLTISALGGSMFPRFLMPEALQKASLAVFNSWALQGFLKVFWREEPLGALWPQVAVLLGTTIVFFAIARHLTRRWELA